MGLPTTYLGRAPPAWCHNLEERCPVDRLLQLTKVLALSLLEYCGGQRKGVLAQTILCQGSGRFQQTLVRHGKETDSGSQEGYLQRSYRR